jgi:hypothetical protein
MGVEADFASVFKTLVNDLKTLGRLPFGKFCDRLHNKPKDNQVARGLFKYITPSPDYPPPRLE